LNVMLPSAVPPSYSQLATTLLALPTGAMPTQSFALGGMPVTSS